jgi:hypothetical protein
MEDGVVLPAYEKSMIDAAKRQKGYAKVKREKMKK